MASEERRSKTDLVLSFGEYAFTQDATTGVVKVLSGPTVVNVTGQESPVLFDPAAERFRFVALEDAARWRRRVPTSSSTTRRRMAPSRGRGVRRTRRSS